MGAMIDVGELDWHCGVSPFAVPPQVLTPILYLSLVSDRIMLNTVTRVEVHHDCVGIHKVKMDLAYQNAAKRRIGLEDTNDVALYYGNGDFICAYGGAKLSPTETVSCFLEALGYKDVCLPQRREDAINMQEAIWRVKHIVSRYIHRILVVGSLHQKHTGVDVLDMPYDDQEVVAKLKEMTRRYDWQQTMQTLLTFLREPMDGWWSEPPASAQGR
jgi:hypothetical protein